MNNRTAFGRERNFNSPCDKMNDSNSSIRKIGSAFIFLLALSSCKQKEHHGIEIEISASSIRIDTSLNICATITNSTDSIISIYPPSIGGYQPFTQYGIITKSDTTWFTAATDLDLDTYPPVKILPKHQYTFETGPGYFELWNHGTNAKQTKIYANLINSGEFTSIRYVTNPMGILKPNSDQFDSSLFRIYSRHTLESNFHEIRKTKAKCDTGLNLLK